MNTSYYILIAVVVFVGLAVFFILRRKKFAAKSSSFTVLSKPVDAGLGVKLSRIFNSQTVDEFFWEKLETTLIEADVGIKMTASLLESARGKLTAGEIKQTILHKMTEVFVPVTIAGNNTPHVILVLGVNGVGKTTTIAKLARSYKQNGKKVLLVAADTFRAAAVEQLKEWGSRLDVQVVSQTTGSDAAAVAFDGVEKARAKGYDVVIIDTAGRLHTKSNLMEELKKIGRVISKAMPGAPHERLLVLDATVGSNGLTQAKQFHESIGLTGVIVTKLDGTAKGGVVFAVAGELGIPITHIGVGEKMDDLKPFDPTSFVASIAG